MRNEYLLENMILIKIIFTESLLLLQGKNCEYTTWSKTITHQMPVLLYWVGLEVKEAQQKSNN